MPIVLVTNAKENEGKTVFVFVGSGGVIKGERFDDETTELYNAEGNVVAVVKETPESIKMNAGSGL